MASNATYPRSDVSIISRLQRSTKDPMARRTVFAAGPVNGEPDLAFPRVTDDDGIIPADHTVWAMADIHGVRSGMVASLQTAGLIDHAERWVAPPRTSLVVVGDAIDRGSDSAGVVDVLVRLSAEARSAGCRLVWVRGNHEQMLADVLRGDASWYETWLQSGGRETLLSFGIIAERDPRPTQEVVMAAMARRHPGLLATLLSTVPYALWRGALFVHAGPPADVGLDGLASTDEVLWGASRFLRSDGLGDRDFSRLGRHLRGTVIGHVPHDMVVTYHSGATIALDTNACCAHGQDGGLVGGAMAITRISPDGPLSMSQPFAIETTRALDRAA